MGKLRTSEHNKVFQHTDSFLENKQLLKEFVQFLYAHGVQPIVAVPPFSPEYNQFVRPEDVYYVDFNQIEGLFTPADFMDTDHLGAAGAEKVSAILVETFGK